MLRMAVPLREERRRMFYCQRYCSGLITTNCDSSSGKVSASCAVGQGKV